MPDRIKNNNTVNLKPADMVVVMEVYSLLDKKT